MTEKSFQDVVFVSNWRERGKKREAGQSKILKENGKWTRARQGEKYLDCPLNVTAFIVLTSEVPIHKKKNRPGGNQS